MGYRHKYNHGDKVGSCIYMNSAGTRVDKRGYNRAFGVFKCRYCKNEFTANISYVKLGNTKSCGCINGNYIHGGSHDKAYKMWSGMKKRCYCNDYNRYHDYGGRGIRVCDEWINSYIIWFSYISKLPHYGEDGFTLDRIDNNGNYEPGNLRWASKSAQSRNTRISRDNKSGFRGVHQRGGSFGCYIRDGKKRIWIGSFKNVLDAAKARDKYIIDNNLIGYSLQTTQI